jgi:patatin-related protein
MKTTQPPSTVPGVGTLPPRFQPTREVRFAVVMYGGVSLAIYINGVAQELLRFVRATAPHTPRGAPRTDPSLADRALFRDDELRPSERVYRKLGQLLGRELVDEPQDAMPIATDPIRTRFVVDILSGSSAGGINAVYLGKALATGRSIDRLRELWFREADVERLLNDGASAPSKELRVSSRPTSLFNNQRMYWQLLEALEAMDLEEPDFPTRTSCFVDELDVWLTATDLQGLLLPIELSDRTVWELRHRNVFRFGYGSEYARGDEENRLQRADNPFLAFACRCTASFPFAFEPMTLADMDAVLACSPFGWYQRQGLDSRAERWAPYFRDYGEEKFFRERAFADGGYLDNKPFTWATRSLRRRRRDVDVERLLLYVEPDPGSLAAVPNDAVAATPPAQPEVDPSRPNALANIRAAVLSLPRKETIRDDLAALLDRNRRIDELGRARRSVEHAVDDLLAPFPDVPVDTWRALPASELIAERGAQYGAYHWLKVEEASGELGRIAGAALGLDEGSDEQEAIVRLFRLWVDRHYPVTGRGDESQHELLLRFAIGYRVRRLNFLLDRSTRLLALDDEALATLGRLGRVPSRDGWRPAFRAWLFLLRPVLGDALVTVRARARLLADTGPSNPLRPRLDELDLTPSLVPELLGATETSTEVLDGVDERLTALADVVADVLAPLFARQRELIDSLLGVDAPASARRARAGRGRAADRSNGELMAREAMSHYWRAFETYDAVLFPIGYGVVGEADRVDVVRISPADATSLVDEQVDGVRKLGGIAIHHFGGFFDERWRRNDFLWGRLDTAERLVTTLLPASELRDELLREAQLAIVSEEFGTDVRTPITELVVAGLIAHRDDRPEEDGFVKKLTPEQTGAAVAAASTPEAILSYYETAFALDRTPDTEKMLRITGRAMTISGRIFDDLSDQPQAGVAARWLSRVGRVLTGVIALASGQNIAAALARNALVLPAIGGVVVYLIGLLFGSDPTQHAGLAVLAATAAVWLFIGISHDALGAFPPAGRRGWTVLALRLGGLAALGFAAVAALVWGLPG